MDEKKAKVTEGNVVDDTEETYRFIQCRKFMLVRLQVWTKLGVLKRISCSSDFLLRWYIHIGTSERCPGQEYRPRGDDDDYLCGGACR